VPKLELAAEGIGPAKYLKNSESCEVLSQKFQGVDIYTAYTGPFPSVELACTAKLSYPRPLAVVRQLSLDSPDRDLCFCVKPAVRLPELRVEHQGLWLPFDQSLVADVQFMLIREGFNPGRLQQGHFTNELTELLRQYQSHQELATTGATDKETWVALHESYCRR
jgi:hypothetical protein